MPNQRDKRRGKLAGAFITPEQDAALAAKAKELGYPNKAEYIRAIYDCALTQNKKKDIR